MKTMDYNQSWIEPLVRKRWPLKTMFVKMAYSYHHVLLWVRGAHLPHAKEKLLHSVMFFPKRPLCKLTKMIKRQTMTPCVCLPCDQIYSNGVMYVF